MALHYEQFLFRYSEASLAWFSPSCAERPGTFSTSVSRAFDFGVRIANRHVIAEDAFGTIDLDDEWKAVFIDEAQFFGEGILDFLMRCLDAGLPVFASALNGDFRASPMGHVSEMLSLATSVDFRSALCEFCPDIAHFTVLRDAAIASKCDQEASQVHVGDGEYVSVCWKCKRQWTKTDK